MAVAADKIGHVSKVLAFFGADIGDATANVLLQHHAEGFTLLALEVPAIGIAHQAGLPFTVIDDWLTNAARKRAQLRALECESRWFELQSDGFSWSGVCWPRLDHHAMHWFWLEVMTAEELANSFKECKIVDLRFFQDAVPRASVYYYPSDVVGRVWQYLLAEVAHPYLRVVSASLGARHSSLSSLLRRPVRGMKRLMRFIVQRASSSRSLARQRVADIVETRAADLSVHRERIVLAINAGELGRFTSIIQRLSTAFPNRVSMIFLGNDPNAAKLAQDRLSIPVTPGPSEGAIDSALQEQFYQAFHELRLNPDHEPWSSAITGLGFQFDYFCRNRWPQLANAYSFWLNLWSKHRPSAVLISSLSDAESLLPGEAATNLGIDCWVIPHGAIVGRPILYHPVGVTYLCGFELQREVYHGLGLADAAMVGCCDALLEREYPEKMESEEFNAGKLSVLAITDPIGFKGCVAIAISIYAQQRAFQALLDVAEYNADRIDVHVKPHPNPDNSDMPLLRSIDKKLCEMVLSGTVDLIDLFTEVDLVVAVNYYGSALVHVLRQHKPIVFLWTDPLIGETALSSRAKLFQAAGVTAACSEDLQTIIERYLGDPDFAEKLRHRSREFARRHLDNSRYPSFAEVLSRSMGMSDKSVSGWTSGDNIQELEQRRAE